MSSFLYEKIENFFDGVDKPGISSSIINNLKYPLRPYQKEALENFICYMQMHKKYKDLPNKHLLFHMATGSGKTNIIASSILYLYEKGYRDFIFFVNTNNIITKTVENLVNSNSNKYLFSPKITINNQQITINQIVDNFSISKKDDINIHFTTIHKLHSDLELITKENAITYDDFKDKKIVLIADEAHHLDNEKVDERSWWQTVQNLLKTNKENILLEFTATAKLQNSYYDDKIIYDYPLIKFREDKYSKDIVLINDGLSQNKRILQAIMISEYRQIVASEFLNKSIKPIIMFKNPKGIKNIDKNFEDFVKLIEDLKPQDLEDIFESSEIKAIKELQKLINIDDFTKRLKHSFAKEKCLVIYSTSEDKLEKLKNLNNLEDEHNHIRAIFAVEILNEGWDVLNLFDIVKLDEAKISGKNTVSEAQLIGRGARYFPFVYENENSDKYKRKFDKDFTNPIKILEEMYFHSVNQSEYIKNLKTELSKIGLMDKEENVKTVTLRLKKSFLEDELYKNGVVYVNEKIAIDRTKYNSISSYMGSSYKNQSQNIDNSSSQTMIFEEEIKSSNLTISTVLKISDFDKNLVRVAINKKPFFSFSNLKKYFTNLKSINQFICDGDFLGEIEWHIKSAKKLNIDDDFKISLVLEVLEIIEKKLLANKTNFVGSHRFYPVRISQKVLKEKTIKLKDSATRIDVKDDWYVFEEHFGTNEERAFTDFMFKISDDLKDKYKKVLLLRNEKAFKIHSFDEARDGEGFEPDFLLLLQNDRCYFQVFCEPKGNWSKDKINGFESSSEKWKNDFLKDITKCTNENKIRLENINGNSLSLYENKCYRIFGLPFYNYELENEFRNNFNMLLTS
ncbi:DEAD/DEAH box helicase family protein [Aliarcobacter butzleri]|uniref:DEAD/DEAH box helicase family protein n=1 Tax=Aliarcobacter butzleri TaxID=28197 RepID=A0AAW7PTV5_9BACT|nr:DEAD/DEAH box helicase family protein [Aliarcobacter butzleri]MCT7538208.1 DEAD/DEAH box helicase family protein [Aliarcobacter butzleri]MCT7624904.1 DEAD/DEAH box helicase family protein [Aliarcobacter butzleri]MDN5064831.1 DEAD/DEAH box helicase family protein [Aliarcobacter butzleri]MDN5066733.1 DEAD/DEAH box helicase family protein [Aliarcobacter butzleri]